MVPVRCVCPHVSARICRKAEEQTKEPHEMLSSVRPELPRKLAPNAAPPSAPMSFHLLKIPALANTVYILLLKQPWEKWVRHPISKDRRLFRATRLRLTAKLPSTRSLLRLHSPRTVSLIERCRRSRYDGLGRRIHTCTQVRGRRARKDQR